MNMRKRARYMVMKVIAKSHSAREVDDDEKPAYFSMMHAEGFFGNAHGHILDDDIDEEMIGLLGEEWKEFQCAKAKYTGKQYSATAVGGLAAKSD